jgi:glycosyltransferase involved in cell wall biosynthesis
MLRNELVVIQIPCFNEESNIARVINEYRTEADKLGIECQILVIDDGSTDDTVNQAQLAGADKILELKINQGLARAFQRGLNESLSMGANYIVNTDGDGQYPAIFLGNLLDPLLESKADATIGDRETQKSTEFSAIKKMFQKMGTWTANSIAQIDIRDAASGYRAYNRESASWIEVNTKYTYTLETLVQLSRANYRILSVPVTRRDSTRPSRLFRNIYQYMAKNGFTLLRVWIQYRPLTFFLRLSQASFLVSFLSSLPFFISRISGTNSGQHIQSLLISSFSLLVAINFLGLGILGDGIQANRMQSQIILQRLKIKHD